MPSIETRRQQTETFHRLHAGPDPLVLVNAWDAVSARLVERAGAKAIATTSAGIAWSCGVPDGGALDRAKAGPTASPIDSPSCSEPEALM